MMAYEPDESERRVIAACRDLEAQADIHAMAGQFGEASRLMRAVNFDRARLLSLPRGTCPNVLREHCERLFAKEQDHDH
jgi:hypothetical protein